MSKVEITTAGDVKLNGDLVGKVTWSRNFVESEVAGVFEREEDGCRLDGYVCSGCEGRDDILDLLGEGVEQAVRQIEVAQDWLKDLQMSDGRIGKKLDEVMTMTCAIRRRIYRMRLELL